MHRGYLGVSQEPRREWAFRANPTERNAKRENFLQAVEMPRDACDEFEDLSPITVLE
jgi:hypothetical protein